MPTLQWSVSPASPVPAGTECMLTLRLDPGAAVLGAASLRLAIPDSGFTVISVTPLAFAGAQDIFEVQAPAAPLAPYVVACARTDGTAGACPAGRRTSTGLRW